MRARVSTGIWPSSACWSPRSAPFRRGRPQCGDSPDGFRAWLEDFKQVAINDGVSPDVVDSALATASFDLRCSPHDHGQGALQGNYASFAARHITPGRIKKGKTMLLAYAEPLEKIEQRYGVPGAGAGRDLGAGDGFRRGLRHVSDFQRAWRRWPTTAAAGNLYRAELVDALMIVQRGLLTPAQMRGAWAGELGPDPIHALGLPQVRQCPPTAAEAATDRQFRRRARLDREFPPRQRLAARREMGRGRARISPPSSNGTARRSTPRRSPNSPTGSRSLSWPPRPPLSLRTRRSSAR